MKNQKEKSPLSIQKLIVLGIAMLVLAIGGGVLGSAIASGKAAELLVSTKEEEKERIIVPSEEFLLNLTPTNLKNNFLKIEFSFLVTNAENEAKLTEEEAMIRDAIITSLRKKTALTVFEEAEGELVIKEELRTQINQILGAEIVEEIFVTNIVMQ